MVQFAHFEQHFADRHLTHLHMYMPRTPFPLPDEGDDFQSYYGCAPDGGGAFWPASLLTNVNGDDDVQFASWRRRGRKLRQRRFASDGPQRWIQHK